MGKEEISSTSPFCGALLYSIHAIRRNTMSNYISTSFTIWKKYHNALHQSLV